MMLRALFSVFLYGSSLIQLKAEDVKLFEGDSVVKIVPKSWRQLRFLQGLMERRPELDFWVPPNKVEVPVFIQMPKGESHYFLTSRTFENEGLMINTTIPNLGKVVEFEKLQSRNNPPNPWSNWTKYEPLDMVSARRKAAEQQWKTKFNYAVH